MQSPILSNMSVKELLDRYPQLLQSFMDLGLLCAGCPTEAFHTIEDVAREYHFDLEQLRLRLERAIEEGALKSGGKD